MKTIKRKFALAMVAMIAVGSVSAMPPVWAKTTKETEIVSFQELPEETLYQQVEYGTKKRSLNLPNHLYAEMQDADSATSSNASAATPSNATSSDAESGDWKRVRVNWILNESFSEQEEYDGEVPGIYVFEAELTNDRYEFGGAELPRIEIEVLDKKSDPFIWETEIDGVKISLTADPGVFQDDAEVVAERIEEDVNAQQEILGENDDTSEIMSFDIHVQDGSGETIQPDGKARLTFTLDEEDISLQLFSIDQDSHRVRALSNMTSDNTVSTNVETFSLYSLVKQQVISGQYVAKIGDMEYKTVEAAVQSVKDGTKATIEMICDSEEDTSIAIDGSKRIVLDLAGHTLTGPNGACAIIVDGRSASLTLKDSKCGKTGVINGVSGGISTHDGGTFILSNGK